MRVIAGSARGTRLCRVPRGVRPVSDMAREGLFASLGDAVADAEVLDLFAGTGALGIEALSRGAAHAVLVERSRAGVEAIVDNLGRTHLGGRARVVRADAARFVTTDRATGHDLVFLDPPYEVGADVLVPLLRDLAPRLPEGAIVVLTRGSRGPQVEVPLPLVLTRRLTYGDTLVLVHRNGGDLPADGRPGWD